jgi:DNA-binding MarR family transcriptional regulator
MATSVAAPTNTPPPVRTPAGDALSALVIRIFQLNGRLEAAGDALARPAGQSTARWQVLAAIEDAPRTVADVARVLGLARQSVQRIADLLADEGLAAYEANPGHRRAKLLRLTPAGAARLATIQAAQREWADRVGAQVGRPELERAVATLDRVARAIGARQR